jgi:hypothetical protein
MPEILVNLQNAYFSQAFHITLFLLDSRISNNLLVNFCSDVCGASAMFSDKVWSDHFIIEYISTLYNYTHALTINSQRIYFLRQYYKWFNTFKLNFKVLFLNKWNIKNIYMPGIYNK